MQILFNAPVSVEGYTSKSNISWFPEAPKSCPHKDCKVPVEMRKHGFYTRNIVIPDEFDGQIYIRRYICPVCGKTVSMLPSFCLPYHQYGVVFVVALLVAILRSSVSAAARQYKSISRRHLKFYLNRLRANKHLITYSIRQMSPSANWWEDAGDNAWTEHFLCDISPHPDRLNADYHKITGKSFMSSQNSVA